MLHQLTLDASHTLCQQGYLQFGRNEVISLHSGPVPCPAEAITGPPTCHLQGAPISHGAMSKLPCLLQEEGLLEGKGIPHVYSAPELQDASAPAVLEGLAVEHRSDSGPPRGASQLRNAWLVPPEAPFQGSSHEGERRGGHRNPLMVGFVLLRALCRGALPRPGNCCTAYAIPCSLHSRPDAWARLAQHSHHSEQAHQKV